MASSGAYKKLNPWYVSLESARGRCNNKNSGNYNKYGGRGIKCLLTREDVKFLWERDHANLLNKPSIDRIDSQGDYTLENCRFIELSDNSRRSTEKKMRSVVQKSLNGNIIMKYRSISDASRALGKKPGANIYAQIVGRQKTAYGYLWEYCDKQSEVRHDKN